MKAGDAVWKLLQVRRDPNTRGRRRGGTDVLGKADAMLHGTVYMQVSMLSDGMTREGYIRLTAVDPTLHVDVERLYFIFSGLPSVIFVGKSCIFLLFPSLFISLLSSLARSIVTGSQSLVFNAPGSPVTQILKSQVL